MPPAQRRASARHLSLHALTRAPRFYLHFKPPIVLSRRDTIRRARSSVSKNRQSVLPDPGKQNCQRDKASLKRDNASNSDGFTARSKKRIDPRAGFIIAVNIAVAWGSCLGCWYFRMLLLGLVFFGVVRFDLFTSARSAQSGAPSPCALSSLSAHAQSLGARRRCRLLRLRACPAHPAQSRFHS